MSELVYLIVCGVVVYFVVRVGFRLMGNWGKSAGLPSGADTNWARPSTAADPVCGMSVEAPTSKSSSYDGRLFYFCSLSCQKKFEASPKSFVSDVTGSRHDIMEKSDEHQH
ncbi:MAG: YHS domain-containing protein [Pseudomonadota bacterium]